MAELQAGTDFYVQDINRANISRFVYLREHQWLVLQRAGCYDLDHPLTLPGAGGLGCLMPWTSVLGYLALVAKRNEGYVASGSRGFIVLQRRLSANELATLLGRTQEEVREELTDFILLVDDATP